MKKNKPYIGIVPDNRPPSEQIKNYDDREIDLGAPEYLTKAKADKAKKLFPNRDQKATSACVCFAICTALYSTEKEILSPAFLYSQRLNKPGLGSMYWNIGDIVVKQGVCSEDLLPTPTTESEINSVQITSDDREDALQYKQKSYIFMDNPTIDTITAKVNLGIPVVLSIFATKDEWSQEYPEIIDTTITPSTAYINHAITALPMGAFIKGGKKYLLIQDSAKFGNLTFRYLSEEWVEKRVTHGMYFIDLEKADAKWDYVWTRDLKVGDTGEDVRRLQMALQIMGTFPTNVSCTEYFGGITLKAVKDFQTKYPTILQSVGLTKPTGIFGPATRKKLIDLLK